MQALAESTQKANAQAYVFVSARIKASLEEIRPIARNAPHN